MNESPQMNRFWIIPASIAMRKDLSDGQKILVGIIISLSNQKGFCWASNDYIADLLGKNERTIRRDLEYLEDLKILVRTFQVDNEGREYFRAVTILEYENIGPDKNVLPGRTKTSVSHRTKTSANNISNNKEDNIRNELRTNLKSEKSNSNEQEGSNSLSDKISSKKELKILASERWDQLLDIWPTGTEKELGSLTNCKEKYWLKMTPDQQEETLQMLREIGTQNLKLITEWKIVIFRNGNMTKEYLQNYISKIKSLRSNKSDVNDTRHNVSYFQDSKEAKQINL